MSNHSRDDWQLKQWLQKQSHWKIEWLYDSIDAQIDPNIRKILLVQFIIRLYLILTFVKLDIYQKVWDMWLTASSMAMYVAGPSMKDSKKKLMKKLPPKLSRLR